MCGECVPNSDMVITCRTANEGGNPDIDSDECGLRFIYCLRPHNSTALDIPLLPGQSPLGGDNVTFEEGFILQTNLRFGNWNRSNPFTRELQQWPVSITDVLCDPIYSHAVHQ